MQQHDTETPATGHSASIWRAEPHPRLYVEAVTGLITRLYQNVFFVLSLNVICFLFEYCNAYFACNAIL